MTARERPIPQQVLEQAIQWQILLDSGEVSAVEREDWHVWLGSHPDHEHVWRQLASLDDQLTIIPRQKHSPLRSLLLGSSHKRGRKTLSALAVLLTLSAGCLLALDRHRPLTGLLADSATATGEQQQIILPDNTLLVLNSRTAVNIQYSAQQRLIQLRTGEIYIESGHANGEQRPLVVTTAEGSMRALGTGFVVRRDHETTYLDVTEAAVLARAATCAVDVASACTREQRVTQGFGIELTTSSVTNQRPSTDGVDAWRKDLLVFNNRPLGEVAAELARYKTGFITVAPEVAQLRVTASLPLNSPDLALTALADALPIQLSLRTHFWTHIEPAKK